MQAPDFRSSVKTTSSTDEYESTMSLAAATLSKVATDERRAEILKKFACLLGTKTSESSKDPTPGFKGLLNLLSPTLDDDDVVLTVPSLDLRLPDGENGVLPEVGEHSNLKSLREETLPTIKEEGTSLSRPNMAASVLTMATDGKANVEQQAAQNIGKQTSWTKSSLRYASGAVGTNIAESFSQLVNARVKAWTLLLLRHSLSTGDNESRTRLLNMLSTKIKSESAETAFNTIPLPPSAAGKPKEADVILPLLFEAHLHLKIQDDTETVLIRAPGTVSAFFADSESDGLMKVMLKIDTGVVLSALVDQARVVVLKAVASATKTTVGLQSPPNKSIVTAPTPKGPPSNQDESESLPDVSTAGLSTLRSALSLSAEEAEQSPQLRKAHSSALKLNSVLHGKAMHGQTTTGLRKIRSVKWEEPVQAPRLGPSLAPNPKKLRMVETAGKLKSFKSFGRPHGGDFGSGPKNATFAAFGGGSAGVWGRDGRLAHHPRPMFQTSAQSEHIGITGVADRNATFDMLKKSSSSQQTISSTRSPGLSSFNNILRGSLNNGSTASGTSSSQTPSLPRTATVLENSLMRKFT